MGKEEAKRCRILLCVKLMKERKQGIKDVRLSDKGEKRFRVQGLGLHVCPHKI
jgi:hypothetical protein